MPKVHVEHSHSMEVAEVRKRMEEVIQDLVQKYELKVDWASDRKVNMKRTGVKGYAEITDNAVIVDLDLSFVLSPMKSKIETRLKEKMASTLS